MKILTTISLLLSIIPLFSCSWSKIPAEGSYTTVKQPPLGINRYQPTEPVIAAGDEVAISIWRHDDLEQSVKVNLAGNIHLPLAGTIHAEGMTIPELREEITLKLSKYIKDPVVNVQASEMVQQSFYTLGEVTVVGRHELEGRLSVFEAIMTAQGPTDDANDFALLLRKEEDMIRITRINTALNSLEDGSFNAHQIVVASGDVIYVPPSRISDIEKFAQSLGNILSPILDIERMFILWPSLVDALNNSSKDVTVAF